MADNRYNQTPGYHGGNQIQMGPGMTNMSTVRGTYVQPNMPMNPMMQQQMMMRFPMQGMRMGPPNTPPPPYSSHQPAGVAMVNQPRTTLSKTKGTHQKSEKERFFEEQRLKLRQFGKPGAKKVDTDSLIGSMFKLDAKPAAPRSKGTPAQNNSTTKTEDDGFGDFLQGPAVDTSNTSSGSLEDSTNTLTDAFEENGEPANAEVEEKKDLTSMMLECSDMSAPQKAKGFHKPTLNEVHRPKHHDNHRRSSFHDSDHSIKWMQTKDLDGLFQLPVHTVAAPVPAQQQYPPVQQQIPPGQTGLAATHNAFQAAPPQPFPQDGAALVSGSGSMMAPATNTHGPVPLGHQPLGPPPTGPPPPYCEATTPPPYSNNSPHQHQHPDASSAIGQPAVNQTPPLSFQATPPAPNGMLAPPTSSSPSPPGPTHLPEWFSYNENQVPPVYKQIMEASLVDGKIATDRLYPILLLSGLPREKLAHLWSMCNTATPGLLAKTELWLILALIALTQNNYDTSRVDILVRCPVPPIPSFSTGQGPPQASSNAGPPNNPQLQQQLHQQSAEQQQQPSMINPLHQVPSAIIPNPPVAAATTATRQPESQPLSAMHHQPPPAPSMPPPAPQQLQQTSSMPVIGAPTNAVAEAEDDFADFQAAPAGTGNLATATVAASSLNGKDMQQEDSFGEFIGGAGGCGNNGGGGSVINGRSNNTVNITTNKMFQVMESESDPLDFPPYLPPRNCREFNTTSSSSSSSIGNGNLPSCSSHNNHSQQRNNRHHNNHHHHHHPQQQQQQQEQHEQPQYHICHHSHNHHNHHQHHNSTSFKSTESTIAIGQGRATATLTGMGQVPPANDMPMPPPLPSSSRPPPISSADMPAALSAMSLDDKYSGNVRSFFCSSDSSTGHTSPSFEDDDFTDGRDSFSQVSTSEQSEIDDIHNFEHYVEEFNHSKKEAPDGSPLHCPFPSVHPNIESNGGGGEDQSGPTTVLQPPPGDKKTVPGTASLDSHPHHSNTNSSQLKNVQIPPPLNSFTQNTFPMKSNPSTTANLKGADNNDDDGDFADFKSASISTPVATTPATATNQSQDKYGAFRELTQETDLMQSSVFETPTPSTPTGSGNFPQLSETENSGCAINKEGEEEDEEWANFAEAAAPPTSVESGSGSLVGGGGGNQNDNHFLSPSDNNGGAVAGDVTGGSQHQHQTSDVKDGILKLFQAGSASTPNSSNEGINSMVNSDSGYSTRSWGGNKTNDAMTSLFDASPSPSSTPQHNDKDDGNKSLWSHGQITDSGIETNWASSGVNTPSSTNEPSGWMSQVPGLGQSASMPTFATMEGQQSVARGDDWGDFSQTRTTTSSAHASLTTVMGITNDGSRSQESSTIHGNDFIGGSSGSNSHSLSMPPMNVEESNVKNDDDDDGGDWADFSTASPAPPSSSLTTQNNVAVTMATAGESGGSAAGNQDPNSANYQVTIKKQNLGTNEIMGLFKVRDDPTTMSTYQLPPSTHTSPSSNKSMGRSRKSSRRSHGGRQMSSDLDEDMVPPPMDSDGEDGDEDHNAFSRGYDLDDLMQRPAPTTTYSLFGSTTSSPVYSRAGGGGGGLGKSTLKLKESKEDSGSVNSLELPSTSQTFDGSSVGTGGGGDNQSTSSMEMGTGNSGGMGSPESKSLDSLDFIVPDYNTESSVLDESAGGSGGGGGGGGKDGASSGVHNQQPQQYPPAMSNPHPHPIQPQELLASMPKLADKYNIDGLAQGNDRYSYEWERCLEHCSNVLTEANTIFNNISSSTVCNEVLKSLHGWEYVSCVIEIYRVACRVMTAMRSTAISSSQLEQTLKEIDLMWNNLSAFLVGASLLPDPSSLVFTDAVIKSNRDSSSSSVKTSSSSSACGVCLLNVDIPTTSTTSTSSSSSSTLLLSLASSSSSSTSSSTASNTNGVISKLSFAGCHYHSTCANFWVNSVDQTLPSLVLPELI